MKAKFYLLATVMFLTVGVSAQKYTNMIQEEWKNNSWVSTLKSTNTYDAQGNLTKVTMEEWNPLTSTWENVTIISYTLNTDGTIKESLTKMWNKDTKAWEEGMKSVFTYDGSKHVLTNTTQMLMGTDWLDFMKATSTYNNGKLTKMVIQSSDFMGGFANSSQNTITYNADGTENQTIAQKWNPMGQWDNASRMTNTYNGSKLITLELNEKWIGTAWQNESKISNTYNANATLKESVSESWSGSAWTSLSKDIFSYLNNGGLDQIITMDWNNTGSTWNNKTRTTFNGYTFGTQVVDLSSHKLKVYPNPFEDQLIIEQGSLGEHGIQVFNSTGQLVNSFKTYESVTELNLGSLKKGVYFMKIQSQKSEQIIKLLKIK